MAFEIVNIKIEEYAESNTSLESEVLKELNRQTHLKVLKPRMLSGHLQGRVLSMLSKMIQPKRILEIGTYTGYSALCLAEGLQEKGKLITIDKNYELEGIVRKYFQKANFEDKIDYIIGDAIEIIPQLENDFDLVFIDADKSNYINYYNMLISGMKSGSYIIADNVLWSGKVTEKAKKDDKDTLILQEFNKMIQNDERVENVLIPILDGLMILRKK